MHLIIVTLILVSVTSGARFRTPSSEVEEIDHEDLEHFRNDHERLSKVLELQDLSEEIKELEHERATRELASIEEVMSKIMRDRRGIYNSFKGTLKKQAQKVLGSKMFKNVGLKVLGGLMGGGLMGGLGGGLLGGGLGDGFGGGFGGGYGGYGGPGGGAIPYY